MGKGSGVAFFFCYILPVIIVSAILAPTIIGLIIFGFMMFRGKDEFEKGLDRCSEGVFSVDWDFPSYHYSTTGGIIESGIEPLDFFLLLVSPLINLLICTLWKLFDFISILVLKILFSVGCLFYTLIKRVLKKEKQ